LPLLTPCLKSLSLSLYKREKLPSYYVSPLVKGLPAVFLDYGRRGIKGDFVGWVVKRPCPLGFAICRLLPYNEGVAMKVVSIVGMAGAGKSEVARVFQGQGFADIRFEEIQKRGLELTEKNERYIRELLRQESGMAAYAKLNLPRIDSALKGSDVVIDGLYSWEEYTFLKNHYRDNFCVVAVWASPGTRYARLTHRADRPLTPEEAASRDKAELENINKGGPIAMADFTIINESSLEDLRKETERIIAGLRNEKIDQTGY
jgi:dephospho-CoA kinase